MTRRIGLLVIANLALPLALSACAGGQAQTDPSQFAVVTGSAVPVEDEITALCAQIVEQKLPVDAATALAESSGYATRITVLDGAPQAATKDIQQDRMSFEVTADVVTACSVG